MFSSASPPTVRLVAGGEDGAYAAVEIRAPAHVTLPPHVCSREDGVVVLIEGEVEALVGDELRRFGPGDVLCLPRSVPRRLCALTDVRLICVAVPGGIERLADLAGEPALDPDDLAAVLSAAGVSLLPRWWGGATP